jgi:hypothetical protein
LFGPPGYGFAAPPPPTVTDIGPALVISKPVGAFNGLAVYGVTGLLPSLKPPAPPPPAAPYPPLPPPATTI